MAMTTAILSCTISGLTNGVSHSFEVRARNSAGTSPASNAVTATPGASTVVRAPRAPRSLSATTGDGRVTLNWSAPTGGGVDRYLCWYKPTSGRWTMPTTTSNRSCTISGLTNGTLHYFEVRARNSAGTSPASNTVTATPNAGTVSCGAGQLYFSRYGGCRPTSCSSRSVRGQDGYCNLTRVPDRVPGKPRNVSVTAGEGSLTVKWDRPSSGVGITGWEVHYSYFEGFGGLAFRREVSDTSELQGGSIPSDGVVLNDLKFGTEYTVRVRARNSSGYGEYSSPISVIPLRRLVRLVGLEVTQGLQDWEGTLKLVKGRTTVVRAFLEPRDGRATPVNVKLVAVRNGNVVGTAYPVNLGGGGSPADPSRRLFETEPGVTGRRDELNSSANFLLTGATWTGDSGRSPYEVTYRLVVDEGVDCTEAIDPDDTCEAGLTFIHVKQPRVRIVRVNTNADASDETDDALTNSELEEQALRIKSLMPIPGLHYELRSLVHVIDRPWGTDDFINLLSVLLSARANDSKTSVYLGVMSGSTPERPAGAIPGEGGVAGLSWLPSSNVAAWYTDGAEEKGALGYARNRGPHEFGHVIGAYHAAYQDSDDITNMLVICSQTVPPRSAGSSEEGGYEGEGLEVYPYINSDDDAELGPMGDDDTEVWGFDTRFVRVRDNDALAVINPGEVYSLMSYCVGQGQSRWIDKYHHAKFIELINKINWYEGPDQSTEGNPPLNRHTAIFSGYITVAADGASQATVSPTLTVQSAGVSMSPQSGDYLLELLDEDGNVVRSVPFDTYTPVADVDENAGVSPISEIWVVQVDDPPDYASYRISETGGRFPRGAGPGALTEIVEVVRSATDPAVVVTEPTAGQVFDGDVLTFSWAGSDPDGDDLSYMVQYSADGGANYETIAVDYGPSSLVVDRDFVAGSATARVRVTVSDGTRSATAESPVFTVALKPPEVFIHSPADGDGSDGFDSLILDSTAYDPEDGSLDASAIQWSSDIDGNLGSGGLVVITTDDLTAGSHVLAATATDSSGVTGSATVSVIGTGPVGDQP